MGGGGALGDVFAGWTPLGRLLISGTWGEVSGLHESQRWKTGGFRWGFGGGGKLLRV